MLVDIVPKVFVIRVMIILKREECHLWHIQVEEAEYDLRQLLLRLSHDEKQRAEQFLVAAPRTQFIVTRSALRVLLGNYLSIPPETVVFTSNIYGKLYLHPPYAHVKFNVSHSGKRALIAICMNVDVGVDIEQHREFDDPSGMARMICGAEELRQWTQLPPDIQSASFYLAWTRKEAIAKALGYGMATNFKELQVSLCPTETARLIHLEPAFGHASDWSLIDIECTENYSAALAARTSGLGIMPYHITPQQLQLGMNINPPHRSAH